MLDIQFDEVASLGLLLPPFAGKLKINKEMRVLSKSAPFFLILLMLPPDAVISFHSSVN
jgi:hypothetical protein